MSKKKAGSIRLVKTYRFEIHNLSKSKLSKLLQTFKQADMLYYKALGLCEIDANLMLALESKVDRLKKLKEISKKLQGIVKPIPFGLALKSSVIESVKAQISSFVELKLSGQDASFPSKINQEYDQNDWFNILCTSTSIEVETMARNAISRLYKSKYRPLSFEKYRISDGFVILSDDKGRLFAFLNLWMSKDKRASRVSLDMTDTRTRERFKHKTSTGMLVPLSCSPTQIEALTKGEATSAKLVLSHDGRLFLMVSVFVEVKERQALYVMGIDRGIDRIATFAIRHPLTGEVIESGILEGETLRTHQRIMEARQRTRQRKGRKYIQGWSNYTTNLMHNLTNEIVKKADEFQCQVVLEDLSTIKNGPHHKRPYDGRKSNFSRMLSRQQYGRLESLLNYKLQSVGLPMPKYVRAAGTSIICPRDGHWDGNNRHDRHFQCTECQYQEDADIVGALNVAGSYICFEQIKSQLVKGEPRPEHLRYSNWLKEHLKL